VILEYKNKKHYFII